MMHDICQWFTRLTTKRKKCRAEMASRIKIFSDHNAYENSFLYYYYLPHFLLFHTYFEVNKIRKNGEEQDIGKLIICKKKNL